MAIRVRQGSAALIVGFALAASGLPAASADPCPGPRCPAYATYCERDAERYCKWDASSDGLVRIPYWVNPPDHPWMDLSASEAVRAVKAAARAWEMYNPRIRFIYMGTTDDLAIPGDNKTVIAWADPIHEGSAISGPNDFPTTSSDASRQADVNISLKIPWRWIGCQSYCTPIAYRWCNLCIPSQDEPLHGGTNGERFRTYQDVQPVLTHELGHVLGLDHPPGGNATIGLTMCSGCDPYDQPPTGYQSRERATPGLGDVLGLKKLYPWKCPKPKNGRYPSAYRYLCPHIKIFAP